MESNLDLGHLKKSFQAIKTNVCGILGLSLIVQSEEFSPIELENKVINFIASTFIKITNEEEFDDCKNGLIQQMKESYAGLNEESTALI